MHDEHNTDSNIGEDSLQLKPGQKFHHRGGNGVLYFQLSVEEKGDGSVYPMTTTAQACNVLPVECNPNGDVVGAYFLSQQGRPETGAEAVALKASGSFCKLGETSTDAAIRSLNEKLGMEGEVKDLILIGQSYGFGDQFRFPIDLFIIKNFAFLESVPTPGCERVRMTLKDIAVAQKNRTFFNTETIDLVASVLLRNQFRDTYEW